MTRVLTICSREVRSYFLSPLAYIILTAFLVLNGAIFYLIVMAFSRADAPAGSVMRGVVSSATKTSRTERTGKLTVAFDQITIGKRAYPIRATVTQAIESEGVKGEAGRIGAGAGVGAVIGGILGGVKSAIAGILIGGGGTVAATEGKDVDLPAGSILRVRMDSGLDLR